VRDAIESEQTEDYGEQTTIPLGTVNIDCDTDKIRRFILSVLWRSSVSKVQFYKYVDLGPYEKVVKDRIFDSAPLLPNEFQTIAMILETGALGKYEDTLFPPLRNKGKFGIILHTLYLGGGLKFLTATGKQTFPALANAIVMNHPDHFLLVPCLKRYMREVNFVPHMLKNLLQAQRTAQL
jgi:hypothetical protein